MNAATPCPDHPVENGYPHVPISTILQEINLTNNGVTSSCLLAEPSPPPATFAKYKRSRITAAAALCTSSLR